MKSTQQKLKWFFCFRGRKLAECIETSETEQHFLLFYGSQSRVNISLGLTCMQMNSLKMLNFHEDFMQIAERQKPIPTESDQNNFLSVQRVVANLINGGLGCRVSTRITGKRDQRKSLEADVEMLIWSNFQIHGGSCSAKTFLVQWESDVKSTNSSSHPNAHMPRIRPSNFRKLWELYIALYIFSTRPQQLFSNDKVLRHVCMNVRQKIRNKWNINFIA